MARPAHPFSFRDFRYLWFSRFVANVAQNAMVVLIGWQVYDIARQTMPLKQAAFQLGMIGMVQFVPLAALTLVTGWTADRFDRRWIGRIVLFGQMLCAAALAMLATQGNTSLVALYAVAAILGVCRAFTNPAIGALAPNLVPSETLPAAIALSSISRQAGAIVGPALGGYVYALSPSAAYWLSTVLLLLATAAMMPIRPVPRTTLDRSGSAWQQMIDGLHYVRRNRVVLGAISLDLFAVLLGGATAMLPIYARDILHTGAQGLGHLRAAPALGSALVALLFAFRPLKNDVGVKMLVAVAAFGLMTIVFGLSRNVPLSLAALATLGACDMFSVYVRQSLIQLWTPDAMRGRVGAVATLFISGSNEMGEAESGLLASAIGPVATVVGGGIGAVIVTIIWWRLFPELAKARTFTPPEAAELEPERELAT